MGKQIGSWMVSAETRRQVMRLGAKGKSHRQIAGEVTVSLGSIARILRPFGGVIRPEDLEVTG